MFKPAAEISPFRLRPAAAAAQGNVAPPRFLIPPGGGRPWPALGRSEVASSSMLRVARNTAIARQAPVLQQRQRSSGQMCFDFKR